MCWMMMMMLMVMQLLWAAGDAGMCMGGPAQL